MGPGQRSTAKHCEALRSTPGTKHEEHGSQTKRPRAHTALTPCEGGAPPGPGGVPEGEGAGDGGGDGEGDGDGGRREKIGEEYYETVKDHLVKEIAQDDKALFYLFKGL